MSGARPAERGPWLEPELRRAYLRLVEEHSGLRLTDHQARDLDDLVRQLFAKSGHTSPRALYAALAGGWRRDLLELLAARLTIGETHFFRVGPQIDALRQTVVPEIVGRRAAQRRLYAWSAGCSTGEEPYTLAIVLRERLPAPDAWDIQLLATDINDRALEAASRATYGEWSFRGTPDEIRRRYFTPERKQWRLVEPIRRMVRFSRMNLLADPIPSPQPADRRATSGAQFDLILCRNVTIYFGPETVQRVYRRFADALDEGGWLVLGPSDPTPNQPGRLEPVYLPGAVLWRRPTASRPAAPTSPPVTHPIWTPRSAPSAGTARPTTLPPPTVPRPPRVPLPPSEPSAGTAPDTDGIRTMARGGDRPSALEHAEQLTRTRPLDAKAHLVLGLLQLDAGAAERALESLRRAAFLDPDNPLAQFSLGRAYAQLGDAARARRTLANARRLLMPVADDQPIPDGEGLSAGELRHAIAAQLAALESR